MTVLLVLFTLITFLVIDHFVQRRRALATQGAHAVVKRGSSPLQPFDVFPHEMALATNHTWLRNNPDGTTTIGLDQFLSRLIGVADELTLPRPGERIVPALAGIVIQSQGRALQLASPLSGDVVDANLDVLEDPSLMLRDPYGKGWLMKVRSHTGVAQKVEEYLVNRPAVWLDQQVTLLRDFLALHSPHAGKVVLQEGGLPVVGVLQQFDTQVWNELGRSFAALRTMKEASLEEARS